MFKRKRSLDDFAEEIKAHLELEADELKSEGATEEEARRKARVEFGNAQAARERFYLSSRVEWLDNLVRDVRFAFRQLIKNPGFSFAAIAVLALGIGACVAIFAFVDAALIKPLPYAEPQRLVHVTERDVAAPKVNISYLDYLDWKRLNTTLSSLDVFTGWDALLSTPTGAEPVPAERVSAGFFRTLGVAPALGRDFWPGEDSLSAPNVVVITFGFWQRQFGGRDDVIGQTVKLSGVPHIVIGVLPKDFEFALGDSPEIWAAMKPDNDCEKHRDCHDLYAVGRLKDGVSVQTALANMQSIARQLENQYPDTNRDRGASVMLLSNMIVGEIRPILLLLLSGAGLLLLIACTNVSSLLLVRSESRKREMAVRGALGASRGRIARQFVTEGMVLVGGGVAAGLAFAYGAMQILSRLISKQMIARMPFLHGLGLNPHVLLFVGILALVTATVFSITPILHLLSSDIHDGLTEGGRTSAGTLWRRIGGRLVVIELATTMVLLTGAGLLSKSLYRLLHVDVGFQVDHLATLHIRLPGTGFPGDPEQVAFTRRLLNRVESLPGVRAAGVTSVSPVTCACNSDWVRIAGRPYTGNHITVNERDVSEGFFSTLRTKLLSGRYFSDAEDASKPKVVVINHTFARKYFPGEDPVGKRIGDPTLSPSSMKQIVGVVEDFKDGALDDVQEPTAYYPFNQNASSGYVLIVRTSQDEHTVLQTLTAAIHQLNLDVGIEQGTTMSDQINDSQTAYFHRSTAYLVGGFAGLALVLSAVGLYGVIAYSVSQRTREIGVRMALGAQRSSVHRMVLREAAWLAAAGIAIGAVCSLTFGRLLQGLLFGVRAWDVSTLAAVATVLGVSAFFASYIPAHRAASVNPMEALRSE
ncbi:MAG TPA: ABC transporter permease [Silvibacterium sp.]|nr:ABC transporter permease [Silvibacterium sp.]